MVLGSTLLGAQQGFRHELATNYAFQNNCSNRSTSTIFGPGGDMTISYQFLEGAKMGSLCGGHIGQIQDGRHPE